MNLLNHNIKINDTVYHVQTEIIPRKSVFVISSLIYQSGEIIWSNREVLSSTLSEKQLEEKAQEFHKNAIKHLRNIFSGNNKNLDILKLSKTIKQFRIHNGKGLFSIEIFKNDNSTLLAAYNPNRFATHIYMEIYKNISKNIKLLQDDNEMEYYIINLDSDRAIVVGDIDSENFPDISYGILVNFNKVTIAMFLNTILPKFIKTVKESLQ